VRVIAGEFRGRRIEAPPGHATRPMLDRVREALFSTLGPWLRDALVLDLFAGSGSLGLEALSRGARHVRFVERGAPALAALQKNVAALGVAERVAIVRGDALDPAHWVAAPDVVLLDPPYALVTDAKSRVLRAVAALLGTLAPEGVVMLHVARGALDEPDLPADTTSRVRRYGTNDLWYLQRPAAS
jgi:16S rRNA (guanine966-N2)-methyltransferase